MSKRFMTTKYYVSSHGNNFNDGLTPQTAFSSISFAEQMLDANGVEGGTIVVIDEINFSSATHKNSITITGEGNTNAIVNISDGKFKNDDLVTGNSAILGPTLFENIILLRPNGLGLKTENNELVFGKNLSMTGNIMYLNLGSRNLTGPVQNLTLNSGHTWTYIGPYGCNGEKEILSAYIEINGGMHGLYIGGNSVGSNTHANKLTGNLNIFIGKDGRVAGIATNGDVRFAPTAVIQIINNGGILLNNSLPISETYIEKSLSINSYWQLNCSPDNHNFLKPTETAGKFQVCGKKYAIAAFEDGTSVHCSENGVLIVPAGTYDVQFSSTNDIINSGTRLFVNKDHTSIDFSVIRHIEKENQIFIGWVDENGLSAQNGTFSKGTVFSAKYIDYKNAFEISEMSIFNNADKGIQIIIKRNLNFFGQINTTETGIVFMPTMFLNYVGKDGKQYLNAELKLDGTYVFNNVYYAPNSAVAENSYKVDTENEHVSIGFSNIEDVNCSYTVRGYFKFIDLNGNNRIVYSEKKITSLAILIKKLHYEKLSEKQQEYVHEIHQTYISNLERVQDILGTCADGSKNVYELANGFRLRDVNFDFGLSNPITIMQLSDFHFNYCNEEDMIEKNPSILSTYQYRIWLQYAASYKISINLLKYADYFADQVMITGDVADYLSYGCLELLETVWDYVPNAIVTMGNHEITQQMQGKIPGIVNAEHRKNMAIAIWAGHQDESVSRVTVNGFYYSSRLIKDGVIVIQLHNGELKLYENQLEPLKKDIEFARKNNYNILVFAHVPFFLNDNINIVDIIGDRTTGNEGNDPLIFSASKVVYQQDDVTKEIYNLLTKNADVIKGFFVGHEHSNFDSVIKGSMPDGTKVDIPQYGLTSSAYGNGYALKITIH